MVFVKIFGADPYVASDVTKEAVEGIAKRYGIDREELNFVMLESLFVHEGQEQTSFQVLAEVLAPKSLQKKEQEVERFLAEKLKNLAVHSHILFTYFDPKSEYDETDGEYPPYLSPDNMVKAEEQIEEQEGGAPIEDLFTGNVFQELDEFVASHPEMGKDEATLEFYERKRSGR